MNEMIAIWINVGLNIATLIGLGFVIRVINTDRRRHRESDKRKHPK